MFVSFVSFLIIKNIIVAIKSPLIRSINTCCLINRVDAITNIDVINVNILNFFVCFLDVQICNINNKNLQKKLDLIKENNIKGMITWVFICCLFFMFLCLFKLLKKEFNK